LALDDVDDCQSCANREERAFVELLAKLAERLRL